MGKSEIEWTEIDGQKEKKESMNLSSLNPDSASAVV
jgi:hypothetical protein